MLFHFKYPGFESRNEWFLPELYWSKNAMTSPLLCAKDLYGENIEKDSNNSCQPLPFPGPSKVNSGKNDQLQECLQYSLWHESSIDTVWTGVLDEGFSSFLGLRCVAYELPADIISMAD